MTALDKSGSTVPRYIIIGDDDPELENYQKRYTNVIVFDKKEYMENVDTMDNFNTSGVPVYVRNFCYDYAKKQGIENFVMLDDDYSQFSVRYIRQGKLKEKRIPDIDDVFRTFFEVSNPHTVLAFSQNGDYIGGAKSIFIRRPFKFKIMNCFFCNANRKVPFIGTLNEDLNAGLILAKRGIIPLTIGGFSLSQQTTQQNKGGLTDSYLELGTYVKSFYSVMIQPSSVSIKLSDGGTTEHKGHLRLHHLLDYNKTFPRILSEKYKKE